MRLIRFLKITPLTRALPLLALLALIAATPAAAQNYPTRGIKIIVHATPGGAIDLIARSLAEKMTVSLGQPVLVENKPDGYTLVIVASSHATNKFFYKAMPYDPIKDFVPMAYTQVVPLMLAVNPAVPAKNVTELVAWIKANPDKVAYASSGHVKSGALRGIAVTTANRSSAFPDTPTIAESSGFAGYDASTWGGILAPSGTPKDIVTKLNVAINDALKLADVHTRLTGAGIEIQS